MKKSRLFLVGLTAVALTGCSLFGPKDDKKDDEPESEYDINPEIAGGTEEEKDAILKTLNTMPICAQNGKSTAEIFPESEPVLSEDNGDGIKLTVKQTIGSYTVNLEWNVPTQEYGFNILKPSTDLAHNFIEIQYKGYEYGKTHGLGQFNWSISKVSCGSAVAANPGVAYKAKIKNEAYKHDDYTIADLYDFVDGEWAPADDPTLKYPSRYKIVDYTKKDETGKYSPYFITNNPEATEKQYLYVNVKGKVLYLSPDGNFGLIADGNECMEIYAGSGTKLLEKNWPNLKVGNYVEVVGNMGQYCGNVQLGFITKILAASANDVNPVPETLEFRELTAAKIAKLKKTGYTSQTQALKVDGVDMNGSLRQVSGTLKAGSLRYCTGKAETAADWVNNASVSQISRSNRIMFELEVGEGQEFTVYYDKHSTSLEDTSIYDAVLAGLNSGKTITVKGMMRYFGNDSMPFTLKGNTGHWSITPFAASHVTAA